MYPGPWARQLTSSTRTPDSVRRAIFTLLPLVAAVVLLPLIAFASPSDPSWIAGIYDDADGDNIVTLVDDLAGVEASSPPMIRRFHSSLHRLLTSSSDVDSGLSSSLLSRGPPWLSVLLSSVCAHASIPRQLSQPLPSSHPVAVHTAGFDLIDDLFLELTQQGSTVKGTLQVRRVSASVGESVALASRGSESGRCPRVADYATGPEATRAATAARNGLALTTLFPILNLQGLDQQHWNDARAWSPHRGLATLRGLPVPLWFRQLADHGLSDRGLPGDPPILIEHVDAQFGWMVEAHPDQAEWRARYPEDSGPDMSLALCRLQESG